MKAVTKLPLEHQKMQQEQQQMLLLFLNSRRTSLHSTSKRWQRSGCAHLPKPTLQKLGLDDVVKHLLLVMLERIMQQQG